MASKERIAMLLGIETAKRPHLYPYLNKLSDEELSSMLGDWATEFDSDGSDLVGLMKFVRKKAKALNSECAPKRDADETSHESYGVLSFARVSHGGECHLFGSDIPHRDTIQMTLSHARHKRMLNNDWFYGEQEIVRVEMSGTQFADLISCMNVGSGVPVTICNLIGDQMENPPFVSKAEQHLNEFVDDISDISRTAENLVEEAKALFDGKKTLAKKDKDEILGALTKISMYLTSNQKFQVKQYQNMMDKTVSSAKAEIEAFMMNRVLMAGQQALVEKANDSPDALGALPSVAASAARHAKLNQKDEEDT